MVDVALFPAIREAIKQNEIGAASPYKLSYACLGASGASFGIFQADTNVNHVARETLRQAMTMADAPVDAVPRIIAAVSKPCPQGNPLSQTDTDIANNALQAPAPAGRGLVDSMDETLFQIVLSELDTCIAAATRRNQTIDPVALLFIALWVNMTGAPTVLNQWLAGAPEVALAPPVGPIVSQQNVESYLRANSFFQLHPGNFAHMQDSVAAGTKLLP